MKRPAPPRKTAPGKAPARTGARAKPAVPKSAPAAPPPRKPAKSPEKSGASDKVRQFTVGLDDDGARLDRWFKRNLPDIGFATISRWARTGQIRIDGKRAAPEDRVATGQVLRVPPGGLAPIGSTVSGPKKNARTPLTPAQIALAEGMVIARTASALVLNKPPGLATQGGSGTFEHVDGLLDALTEEDGPRPRLVHRLDKDTSGVLLVARTPGSAAHFSKSFSSRSARKIYWALVAGDLDRDEGLIELPLAKQPGTGGEKMMVDHSEHGLPSRTRYRVIDRAGNRAAWVELQPFTGRTHQLRVHMAAIGHPIVGDGKYGGIDAFLSGIISRKMHLHARRLRIDPPEGGTLDVTAPLPEHMATSMESLGFSEADGAELPPRPAPGREDIKAMGRAHAKQVRKERRGERRGRADGPAPERKPVTAKFASGKAASSKSATSKPTPRLTAADKAFPGRPMGGKGGARRPAAGRPGADRAKPDRAVPERTEADRPARGRPTGPRPTSGKPSGAKPTGRPPRPRPPRG
jgi:23S rRNA pseudouridine955/2504/2580 synthase